MFMLAAFFILLPLTDHHAYLHIYVAAALLLSYFGLIVYSD